MAAVLRTIAAGTSFLSAVSLSRSMGIDQAGLYMLAFSFITLLITLSKLGLENTIVKLVGRDKRALASVKRKATAMAIGASGIIAAILWLTSGHIATLLFSKDSLAPVLKNMSLAIPGLTMVMISAAFMQARNQPLRSIATSGIIINLVLITTATINPGLRALDFATILSFASSSLAAAAFLSLKEPAAPKSQPVAIEYRMIIASCLPLLVVTVCQQISIGVGIIISGAFLDERSVALLSAATRSAFLVSLALMAVNMVVAPELSRLIKEKDTDGLKDMVGYATLASSALGIFCSMPLFFFSENILQVFGPDFSEGSNYLVILTAGQLINSITGPIGILLIMAGFEKEIRNITILSAIAALALSSTATLLFGGTGNAAASAVIVSIQNMLTARLVHRHLNINVFKVYGLGWKLIRRPKT